MSSPTRSSPRVRNCARCSHGSSPRTAITPREAPHADGGTRDVGAGAVVSGRCLLESVTAGKRRTLMEVLAGVGAGAVVSGRCLLESVTAGKRRTLMEVSAGVGAGAVVSGRCLLESVMAGKRRTLMEVSAGVGAGR